MCVWEHCHRGWLIYWHFCDFESFIVTSDPSAATISPHRSGLTRASWTATRSDPLQIVLIRACLCGSGACTDFTLKSAALIKTNPTEWPATMRSIRTLDPHGRPTVLATLTWSWRPRQHEQQQGLRPPRPMSLAPPVCVGTASTQQPLGRICLDTFDKGCGF